MAEDATDGDKDGDEYWIYSPNENLGHGAVCGYGDACGSVGDEWWAPGTHPGGPSNYCCGDDAWQ